MSFDKEKREMDERKLLLTALLAQGTRKFKDNEYEQSRDLFEQAVALEQHSAEAHAWLAATYGRLIGTVWTMMDKIRLLSQLEREIAIALRIDPELPLARRMNGARLLNTPDMLGGDPAAAAEEFRYCIERGMDDAEIWICLAECHMQTKESGKAVAALGEALHREPHNERAIALMDKAAAAEKK